MSRLICFLVSGLAFLASREVAVANTITFTEISGSYTINEANWNGSSFAVSGQYANGNPFVFQNGIFTNLDATGFLTVGAEGAVGNFFLGNALLPDFSTEGLVYSSTGAILNVYTSLGFATAGNGAAWTGENSAGQAVYGYIDSTGHVTSMQSVTFQGAENSANGNGVNGSVVAGLTAVNGGSLKAFLSINGTRQTLDVGVQSVAYGVDASTNLAFGERNGNAVWWDSSGAYHEIPVASGSGTITGAITSSFGGLFTVKDSNGVLWISNGSTTKSFFDYTSMLGISISSLPSDAFFVGNGSQSALVFEGSIAYAMGPTVAFGDPLGGSVANTPEPNPAVLLGTGLAILLLAARFRKVAR